MAQYLNFNESFELIRHVGPHRTIVFQGENGIGKTAMHYYLRDMAEYAGYVWVSPIECTQLSDGSVWMPDIDRERGVSRELPNERFGLSKENRKGVKGSRPVLICLDEVGKPPQFIKNILSSIIYERRIGDNFFPDGSIVYCCTNLMIEGLGDVFQPHLRSRLVFANMRKPTQQEWKDNFALPRRLNPAVIAFTELHPNVFDSFLDYEPGGKFGSKDQQKENPYIFNPRVVQDGFASPRTLHAASDVVNQIEKLPPIALQGALEGTVGEATAAQLASFVRFQQELVPYEQVIGDPAKAPLTTNPTAQMVQVFQFITRAEDREEAAQIVKYVKRLRNEMQTLFCTNVANSQRIVTFANAPGFSEMLQANRIFLGGGR